jgi:hypothetical protein
LMDEDFTWVHVCAWWSLILIIVLLSEQLLFFTWVFGEIQMFSIFVL